MFPIFDARGDAVGFGGRALGDDGPKYKNSPETPVYQKSRLLYGLNWAKAEIVARGEAVICEGYTDVMAYALAGAPNAVATCGTALSPTTTPRCSRTSPAGWCSRTTATRPVPVRPTSGTAGSRSSSSRSGWPICRRARTRATCGATSRNGCSRRWSGPSRSSSSGSIGSSPQPISPPSKGRARAAEAAARDGGRAPERARARPVRRAARRAARPRRRRGAQPGHACDVGAPKGDAAAAASPGAVSKGPEQEAPPERVEPLRVDRRELDVLRWAVHEPELVADWLDEALFLDPTARGAYDLLVSSQDMHQAIDAADGPVRHLLERLAVEDPQADDEPTTLRARLDGAHRRAGGEAHARAHAARR